MMGRLRAAATFASSAGRSLALTAVLALRCLSLGCLSWGCFGTPTPLVPNLSGSVGWPHHGVQTGAEELPERGDGFARYRMQGEYYWGQPALVTAIQRAAARVHEAIPGGAPLLVGDLSARHGGKIARHYTHRTGRDVDLLWYVTNMKGVSVPNLSFAHIGKSGVGRSAAGGAFVRLDVPRQWLLVKELITSSLIEVQWLYCSTPVEGLLIEHAVSQGEAPELVRRAEQVLLQPPDSLPHDDHLHLRIACSPEDSARGCEGGGPYWEWLPPLPSLPPGEHAVIESLEVGWL